MADRPKRPHTQPDTPSWLAPDKVPRGSSPHRGTGRPPAVRRPRPGSPGAASAAPAEEPGAEKAKRAEPDPPQQRQTRPSLPPAGLEGRSASTGWRLPEPPRRPRAAADRPSADEAGGEGAVSPLSSSPQNNAPKSPPKPKRPPATDPPNSSRPEQEAGQRPDAGKSRARSVAPPSQEAADARAASADRLRAWANSPQAAEPPDEPKRGPEELDDFAIIERIVPRTKPRGILGISFGSIKIEDAPPPGPAAPKAPEAREVPEGDDAPRPLKKSLFSIFRKVSPEGSDEPLPDAAERKRARQAERARKREEKQARKEARRAASRAATKAGAGTDEDLPGPPPESLRRPYPELRKPISPRAKRARPEPFPELRKPPDQRRPRPEPFPELRKPGRKRPPPEPFPELRKPKPKPKPQPEERLSVPEQPESAHGPAEPLPSEGAASPEPHAEGEERRSGGGWLSDVLKSADRATSGAETPPPVADDAGGPVPSVDSGEAPDLLPAAEGEDDAAAADAARMADRFGAPSPEETPPAEPAPEEEDEVPWAEHSPTPEEGMPHPDGPDAPDEEPDGPGTPDEFRPDLDRRRVTEVLAQAAILDKEGEGFPSAGEGDPQAAYAEDAGHAGPPGPVEPEEPAEPMLPEDTAREAAEIRERMDEALRHDATRRAAEARERAARSARHGQRKTPPDQLELGLPADAPAGPPETPEEATAPLSVEEEGPPEPPGEAELPETPYTDEDGIPAEAAAPVSWQAEPIPPASDAPAGGMQEPPGNDDVYEAPGAEDVPHDEAYAEAVEEPFEPEELAGEEGPSVSLPYAELLDPTYRPKQGFMDLGRRSILFPDEDEEDGQPEAFGEEGLQLSEAGHDDDLSEPEESGEVAGGDFETSHSADPEHALSFRDVETPDEPPHPEETKEEGTPEVTAPAGQSGSRDAGDDDEYEEEEAPAVVPPESSGRPDEAATLMRSIAHADPNYYLPPSKTPGMILLGLAGAVTGAVAGNIVYGMLGDIIVPRFMVILIGIQIFGGLGVYLGTLVLIPLGQPRRRASRHVMADDEWLEQEWDFEETDNREPVRAEPRFKIPDEAEPQDARAAMRH